MVLAYLVFGFILSILLLIGTKKLFPDFYDELLEDFYSKFCFVIIVTVSWLVSIPIAIVTALTYYLFKFLDL